MFAQDIDAAVLWPNGKAYFFKGDSYLRYDAGTDSVDPGFPASVSAWRLPFEGSVQASHNHNDGDAGAPRDRQYYLNQAYVNAFGVYDEPDWDPEKGYAANRDRIVKLYDYYKDTYLKRPDQFLWAGLGRMAGGAVVGGLDLVIHGGETFLTKTMVRIGKAIFHDLAWLHEAFLDDSQVAIDLATTQDADSSARRSYADALKDIASGDSDRIASGNRALLENEQFSIIQPLYDDIAASREALIFDRTRAFTSKIHPYHRDFLVRFPTGDVITAKDRWDWITEEDGMWAKWETMGSIAPKERTRLVSLTFSDILNQRFDPVVDELMPIGANDED